MDWSDKGVPPVWGVHDVEGINVERRHLALKRTTGETLYVEHGVALAMFGRAVDAKRCEGPSERQRAAIIRDRRIDYAILGLMLGLSALALVLAWLR